MGTWKSAYTLTPQPWRHAIDEWVEDLADRGRRPATRTQYRTVGERFSVWLIEREVDLFSVAAADVRAWVRAERERGIGGRSIAIRLSALRSLYDYLVREELMMINPARAVENPRFRKPLPQVLTPDQLATVLDLPLRRGGDEIGRRDTALLRLLAWTGLRVGEVAALDWDQLDLTRERATVAVIDGKGGRDRVVPVVGHLADALGQYLEVRLPLGHQRAVFTSVYGRRLAIRRIREVVVGYGDRIGVRLYPHKLRAQCGVEMIRAGASLSEVRSVLGHAGYDTLVPYTMVAAEEARGALEGLVVSSRRTRPALR